MIEGGRILTTILFELHQKAKIGENASKIDELAEELILKNGARPAFKDYKPAFAKKKFPATICFSKNEVIVHGIPRKDIKIKEGDIVKIDIGLIWKELYLDCAITIGFEPLDNEKKLLIQATLEALKKAIDVFKFGNYLSDVSEAIELEIKKYGFKPIYNLCGHGVGYALHEEPEVLNFKDKNRNLMITNGLVVAIEPMAAKTNFAIELEDESFKTEDNSFSAHFEATVGILKNQTVIMTDILKDFSFFIKS